MFAATDTEWAPWYVAHSDSKRPARLNIISHLLSQVPYKPLPAHDVTLPKRQRPGGYVRAGPGLRHGTPGRHGRIAARGPMTIRARRGWPMGLLTPTG